MSIFTAVYIFYRMVNLIDGILGKRFCLKLFIFLLRICMIAGITFISYNMNAFLVLLALILCKGNKLAALCTLFNSTTAHKRRNAFALIILTGHLNGIYRGIVRLPRMYRFSYKYIVRIRFKTQIYLFEVFP